MDEVDRLRSRGSSGDEEDDNAFGLKMAELLGRGCHEDFLTSRTEMFMSSEEYAEMEEAYFNPDNLFAEPAE